MATYNKQQELDKLRNASPWELPNILESIELYDKKTAEEAIDEVYKEFETGENLVHEIVTPVFYSIVDGIMLSTSFGRAARKKGLTPSRVIQECQSFSYRTEYSANLPDGLTEYINAEEGKKDFEKERTPYQGNRKVFEDKNKMNTYKKNAVKYYQGKRNIEDEYTKERNITAYRNNPDLRRNDEKHDYQAEPDHIVPLAQLHKQMSKNFALSDRDIKNIANIDENLALTSGLINGKKSDKSNSDFIQIQEQLKKEGKSYVDLSDETKSRMLNMEKEAQSAVNEKINEIVFRNLVGKGIADRDVRTHAHKQEEERLGRKLTEAERNAIDDRLGRDRQIEIGKKLGHNAINQAKDYAIGNVILYILKPLYYEIKDIFINGLEEGVNANSVSEALSIRFKRVKDYTINNLMEFIGSNLKSFILNIISSLIEGIISLFVGVFKQILKVAKEGVKVAVESCKILFGEGSANMSNAEKGDAILKLFAGTITTLFGVLMETALNNIGIGEPWSVSLSVILSGFASAFVMYGLNKADLFNVKAEKRKARLKEVFEQRIKDIREAKEQMTEIVLLKMQEQRLEMEQLTNDIYSALDLGNMDSLNLSLDAMAQHCNVKLNYSNADKCAEQIDDSNEILF